MRTMLCTAITAVVLTAIPQTALAQSTTVPQCTGTDAEAANRLHREGMDHYRRATRGAFDEAEMEAALRAFDAACAAGDDAALEVRAYALAGLRRFVEAAESLDEFVARHALESLPPDVRDRVAAQRVQILAQIATLSITANIQGARVTINGRDVGALPLADQRLPPGPVTITVSKEGYVTQQRSVDVVAGSARTEPFTLVLEPVETSTASPPPNPPVQAVTPPRVRRDETGSNLRPIAIGTSVAGAVFLGAAIGTSIWRNERAGTYDANCPYADVAGCDGLLASFETARTIQITSFVLTGIAVATSAVLWMIPSPRSSHRNATLGPRFVCGISVSDGVSASCVAGF